MSSTAAAGVVQEALLARLTELLDGVLFDLSISWPARRAVVTVYDGVAAQRPTVPYVIVGGSSSEADVNTLGPATGAKWGSSTRVPIRLVTQAPTSEGQTWRIWSAIKQGIDGQRLTVAGYGQSAQVDLGSATLLVDTIGGVVTRELVGVAEIIVHQ